MQFGRTDDLPEDAILLPPDDPGNREHYDRWQLEDKKEKPQIYIGAPVWGHPGFVGKIYPKGSKSRDFLALYGQQFNCVELNATYYGLPPLEQIHRWRDSVGDAFRFSPKFPQAISHEPDLPAKEVLTARFLDTVRGLGDRLGMAFLQLPPSFGPERLEELSRYLEMLPRDFSLGVEFRHPALFQDKMAREDWATILEDNAAAAVITDTIGRRDVLHQRLCADTLFLRWTGNNGHPSDKIRLDDWVERLALWIGKGLRHIYFYVHQPDEEHSIESAHYLVQALNERLGLDLKAPRILPRVIQQDLFGDSQ